MSSPASLQDGKNGKTNKGKKNIVIIGGGAAGMVRNFLSSQSWCSKLMPYTVVRRHVGPASRQIQRHNP